MDDPRTNIHFSGPDQVQLAFNCGALGYGAMAAHGHADALSIWLSVGAFWALIDPGTGAFDDDASVREYYRSTRAHNTIEVDGLDQSVQAGPTIWHRQARPVMDHNDLEPDVLARGRHDGYTRLRDPCLITDRSRWVERAPISWSTVYWVRRITASRSTGT